LALTVERAGWRQVLKRHGKDLALIGFIVLAMVLCFADVLFLPNTFYYQDIQFLHYPGKIYFTETLREGNYGFWNPYIFAGYPLQAEPEVGPLYPLNFFFLLPIPAYFAQTLFVFLHYVLAGAFAYFLGRHLGLSRPGAMVTALIYAFSGYLQAQLTNFSILTAVIWLPLILLLFSLAVQRRRYRYAVGCGFVIALLILTAHPQFILLTLTTLGLFYLYHLALLWRDPGQEGKGRLALTYSLLLIVAVGLGVALSAPQLGPAYELKSSSVLSESLGFDFVTSYSLSPYRMVSFLFPNFLGNQATGYRGPAFYEEHHDYIGLLPLLLVVLAWAKRRDKGALFFWLLVPLSMVMAWGRSVPIYHLIADLPLFNLFRVPARWLYPMTLGLAVLAGFGFDHLLASQHSPRLRRMAKILLIIAAALTVTLPWLFVLRPQAMALTGWFVEHVYPSFAVYTLRSVIRGLVQFPALPPSNLLLHAFPFLINPLISFLVIFDLSAVLLYLYLSGRWDARRFRAAAILLIVLDLLMVSGSAINPVIPATYFDRRESTAFLQQNVGLSRILPANQDGDPNWMMGHYFPMIYHLPSFGGSSSLTVRWVKEYRDAATRNPRLYDLAGIKYVLQETGDAPRGFSSPLREVLAAPGVRIFENPNVMPRAFIVHQAALETAQVGSSPPLEDPGFPFEKVVLLDDPGAVALLGQQKDQPTGTDSAQITHYSYNDLTVETHSDQPGFLFLSDSYYPGWEVLVDGQPQRIYRADHMFRAVFLPPGAHTVVFHFAQPAFWWGVAIAVGATGLLAAVGIGLSLRSARQPRG